MGPYLDTVKVLLMGTTSIAHSLTQLSRRLSHKSVE